MRRPRVLPLLAGGALAVAGVAALGEGARTASAPAPLSLPPVRGLPAASQRVLAAEPVALVRDAATRRAEMLTLRVRNISCGGETLGSGFAVSPHTLVTNRHVLAGAAALQMDTWNGTSIEGDVGESTTGQLVDIGVTTISQTLPVVAKLGPAPKVGAPVTAVGYPLAGPLTLSGGKVLAYLNGLTLPAGIAHDGPVMEVSAKVKHGNSGGPLLDSDGRVVGVIYAGQPGATLDDYMRVAYAIPVRSLTGLVREGSSQTVIPCER